MPWTKSQLFSASLIEERETPCVCPVCGFMGAHKITETWEGEVLVSRTSPQTGGYFGERPEEYGEGYADWEPMTVEEEVGVECSHCSV